MFRGYDPVAFPVTRIPPPVVRLALRCKVNYPNETLPSLQSQLPKRDTPFAAKSTTHTRHSLRCKVNYQNETLPSL